MLWNKFLREKMIAVIFIFGRIFAYRWKNRKNRKKLEPAKISYHTVGTKNGRTLAVI